MNNRYINKNTKSKVIIVHEGSKGILVRYMYSGSTYWYPKNRFNHMFKKLDK